jgi:hypothetical protein
MKIGVIRPSFWQMQGILFGLIPWENWQCRIAQNSGGSLNHNPGSSLGAASAWNLSLPPPREEKRTAFGGEFPTRLEEVIGQVKPDRFHHPFWHSQSRMFLL